jgi:hypothetical protein
MTIHFPSRYSSEAEIQKRCNVAPHHLLVAILLLLPVLYVGSYLALVSPDGYGFSADGSYLGNSRKCHLEPYSTQLYRFGGGYADVFFWPLEQIDRKLRRQVWEPYPFW